MSKNCKGPAGGIHLAIQQEQEVDGYKYDVAFSFLGSDENLATELCDKLKDRFDIFLYSKKQEELAGKDGEQKFNSVFESEARIVVVLFRKEWGETPWTRIEQTAIRNRAHDKGYDFTLFIQLEPGVSLPGWMPKNRLWFGLDQYGIGGALSVIEARIQEAGGQTRPETFEERTTRLNREMETEKARKSFLKSDAGVHSADMEIKILHEQLTQKVAVANDSAGLKMQIWCKNRVADVTCEDFGLSVDWGLAFGNSLEGASLEVTLWKGRPSRPGVIFPFDEPRRIERREFLFDRWHDDCGWREKHDDSTFLKTSQLAELCAYYLLDKVHSEQFKEE